MNHYKYDDISIGTEATFSIQVTEDMMSSFLKLTGDINPLHNSEQYAKQRGFNSRVVYGMLTASFLSTLGGVYLPGVNCLIYSIQNEFCSPVYIGDILIINGIVKDKDDRFKTINIKTTIRNKEGVKVCRGFMKVGVKE